MNEKIENTTLSPRTMTQMNLRVSTETAKAFKEFCQEQGMTQNESLASLLLFSSHHDNGVAENALLVELQRYKKSNEELSEKCRELNDFQKRVKLTDWKRCRDWATVAQSMFDYIVDLGPKREPSKMKVGRFKWDGAKELFHAHKYLEGSGCIVVKLDGFLYSKGFHSALFVLAHHVENGKEKLVKFRWYPSDRFFGVPLRSTEYAYPGALWLMGYMPATDGSSMLISALPVESIKGTEKLFCTLQNAEKSNLDMIIADANQRKKTI